MIRLIGLLYVLYSVVYLSAKPIIQYPNAIDRQTLLELKKTHKESLSTSKVSSKFKIRSYNKHAIKKALEVLHSSIDIIDIHPEEIIVLHALAETKQIEDLIKNIDVKQETFTTTFYIYEINNTTEQELDGLTTPPERGVIASWSNQAFQYQAGSVTDYIKILEQQGEAVLIMEQSIKTVANEQASLVIGETFPYITTTSTGSQLSESLKQIDSGINIKCVTQRVTSQSVLCNVSISWDTVKSWKKINNNEYPELSTKQFQLSNEITQHKIALLTSFRHIYFKKNISSLPIINKIPLLKWLFMTNSKQKKKSLICLLIKVD